jgi:hypothetical protein
MCGYKYEDILAELNFLTLHLRRWNLSSLFLIDVLKEKLVAHLFWILLFCAYPVYLPDRDHSTFTVHRGFKVTPSAKYVSAASAAIQAVTSSIKTVLCLQSAFKTNYFSVLLHILLYSTAF